MKKLLSILLPAVLFNALAFAEEPMRIVLTDIEKNIYIENYQKSGTAPDCEQQWHVKKYILHGGTQEGVEIVEVNNGKLTLKIIPTRGMSIYEVTYEDIRLGWDSPVKGPVHPQFVNLESRNGLGWLYGFNEWMVRCGLEFFGGPGPDEFIDNKGDKSSMNLTLHGRLANIPASVVEIIIENEAPYRIKVRGKVDEALLHGPKLQIWTEVSTTPCSNRFQISDVITNNSAVEQEFGILYHGNYGPPLMEKGSRFIAPVKKVTPINDHAAGDIDRYNIYRAPAPGFAEQVYCIENWADANDRTTVMLHNENSDRAVSISYSVEELPFFTLWKNPVAIEDGYVTGLEPGTGYPRNRSIERKFGRVPKLPPHQSRSFTLDFEILTSKNMVQSQIQRINKIQSGRKTITEKKPLP